MPDHERAMLAFVQLADISRRKRQQAGQEKFLVLTALSAIQAGWPDVAAKSREAILQLNPKHLLRQYESISEALKDQDFGPFVRRMHRFCTYEKAETLLEGLGVPSLPELGDRSAGEFAIERIAAAPGDVSTMTSPAGDDDPQN